MAVGSAGTQTPGLVAINANQSAAQAANVPQVVLDDPVNGSVVVHLGGKGPVPTIAVVVAGAGTGATAVLDANATDVGGQITLTTGSAAWAIGAQATVTFGTPFTKAAYADITPASLIAANIAPTVKPWVSQTLTGFTINFATADSAAHVFVFNYNVTGN